MFYIDIDIYLSTGLGHFQIYFAKSEGVIFFFAAERIFVTDTTRLIRRKNGYAMAHSETNADQGCMYFVRCLKFGSGIYKGFNKRMKYWVSVVHFSIFAQILRYRPLKARANFYNFIRCSSFEKQVLSVYVVL